MPYWDWARLDTQIVPKEALNEDFRVKGPPSSASRKEDYNPLFQSPFANNTSEEISVSDMVNLLASIQFMPPSINDVFAHQDDREC